MARACGQKGLALVLVLWMLTLMTIMAGSFSLTLHRESELVSSVRGTAQARALAEGGIYYAMPMLVERDPTKRWKTDGTPYPVSLGTGRLTIRVLDEEGKLDMNTASDAALRELFLQVTGDEGLAQRLSDAIVDWRDPDDLKRPSGAERSEYEAMGKTGPRNRPFQVADELMEVLGLTRVVYQRIEPLITVYTGRDGINPVKAGPEMLRIVFKGDEAAVAEYIAQRSVAIGNAPPPIPANRANSPIKLTTGGDTAYGVWVEAVLPDGDRAAVEAVLKRQQNAQHLPFSILNWKIPRLHEPSGGFPAIAGY
ncbi:type II secretion system protein GspK [Methylococcus sp. ANG]|uniref:general secretion pathway protein GspK n=1 Tax=unclassified Methylococcus TaxID=2618889 RepID=UPI001C52ECA1|nr:type II secretion system protein GspK [Methylococcus sp. Mc7]QXP84067.1 general secretion pathway protein GspK [Methylococcus sp. Mc7]